jgi:hypothetical protein
MRTGIALLAMAAGLHGQVVSFRDWKAADSSRRPAMGCSSLRALTDLEISVVGAHLVAAAGDVPEHCRVSVMAQPELGMEINLPSGWNGRFLMVGNGGWAGEAFDSAGRVSVRARSLRAGFALASTDTGHSAAKEPGASFASNRQKLLDYGFRSLHVTAETAKKMIRAYYGVAPEKSYYEGCSQGGRQGLTIAQRFPADFDGIVAGAPSVDQVGTHSSRAYWAQVMEANPLPPAKLPLLARKVYEYCDPKDGLKDGLIDDPLGCGFRAGRDLPRCGTGQDGAECFTASEITGVEKIYGDVMAGGKRYFPGWAVGAEVVVNGRSGWLNQPVAEGAGLSTWSSYGYQFLRYIAPTGKGAADGDAREVFGRFNLDRDAPRLAEARDIINADDPDLTEFRKRGGKLLMYYGWADPQLNARMGVEYVERVRGVLGAQTPDTVRLFMVPGMFHCGGGIGTSQFDAASALVKWVEEGKAPERIEAQRVVQGQVVRSRPLCVYPERAVYKGSGSVDESANFVCAVR